MDLIKIYKKFGNPEILLFAYDRKQKKYVLFDQELKEFKTLKQMKKYLFKKYRNVKLGSMPKIRFILETVDGSEDFVEWSLFDFLKRP